MFLRAFWSLPSMPVWTPCLAMTIWNDGASVLVTGVHSAGTSGLAHILSNCPTALTQGRYTWRHNSVLSSLIKLVQPLLKEGMILFSDMPGYQAPHGGTVPPHVLVTTLKPDIVIINEQSEEVIIFELTCPWDSNISRSQEFLQWNTRTKDHFCANFQDIWLSSKSWISDIEYAISFIKMQILNQFFRKRFTILLL